QSGNLDQRCRHPGCRRLENRQAVIRLGASILDADRGRDLIDEPLRQRLAVGLRRVPYTEAATPNSEDLTSIVWCIDMDGYVYIRLRLVGNGSALQELRT